MAVPIKRLSRAFVPLALLVCALATPAAFGQQRRGQPATRSRAMRTPAPSVSPQAAPRPTPQPQSPSPPQTRPETTSQPASQISEDEADLAITANVTAQSLRFEAVPNVTVEFPGRPRRETAWEAERTNLPRPVQPGVTYRDVGVRLKIVSVFADIDRIVAEALGEVPPSDEQAQPSATPPDAAPSADDTARTVRAAAGTTRTERSAATSRATATGGAAANYAPPRASTDEVPPRASTDEARPRASASRRARTRPSGRQR